MEKRITELGKSYWNNNGAYQKEYDELYEKLVPSSGEADTVHGEMIRATSRLFYDFCNNGNCNVVDFEQESCDNCGGCGYEEEDCYSCDGSGHYDDEECDDCGGSGEHTYDCSYCDGQGTVDGNVIITPYYQDMIDFLYNNMLDKTPLEKLEQFLLRSDIGYGSYTFNNNEMEIYNNLVDAVMHQVLTTENKEQLKA